jgi:maltoporin
VNLWLKVAGGLAAYGDKASPFGLAPDRTSAGAREVLAAASGNWEWRRLGLLAAAYARFFRDADPNDVDPDDGWEWIAAARPHVFLTRHFAQAAELSVQARHPRGVSPESGEREVARVTRLSAIPILTPLGPGTMTRPHLRLVYTASWRNAAARRLIDDAYPRAGRRVEHYLGVQAEWWFDSSYR